MKASVAILDDGISSGILKVPQLTEQLCIKSEDTTEENSRISHGTICASILENLAPGIRLNSVTVLDRSEKGFVDGLVSGLGWCLSLYDISSILVNSSDIIWKFLVLAGTGVATYFIGSAAFAKRDLPL